MNPEIFAGAWQVRRTMVDYRAGVTRWFEGTATIAQESFEEKGQLRFDGRSLNATRSYGLRLGKGGAEVLFSDGSEFIRLGTGPVQAVQHLCGADRYRGRFFFVDEDTWAEAWRVVGPQKWYASVSHYRRVATDPIYPLTSEK